MEKKFEFVGHTADIAVKVYGATKEELFSHAAEALGELLVENAVGRPATRIMSFEAETDEDLLVDFLNELISLFFTFSFLGRKYSFLFRDHRLEAVVEGIDIDPAGTIMNREVKAATYHDLLIRESNEGFAVMIVFDV